MRYLFWLTTLFVLFICLPLQAAEVRPLADCSIKVFKGINKSHAWSGKAPEGCVANIYVEKRPTGIFVTTWTSAHSENGWVRLSFSSAMALAEIDNGKLLKQASQDITTRAARIERCLNSIIRENDPLECRDNATKSYLGGETSGVEYLRQIWLDDNGRHSVVEYAYGDSNATVSPPADLINGPALPPGTKLNIHVLKGQ